MRGGTLVEERDNSSPAAMKSFMVSCDKTRNSVRKEEVPEHSVFAEGKSPLFLSEIAYLVNPS